GNDIFNIITSVTSARRAGTGDDRFNILAGGITASVAGGEGNDTINGFNDTNFWTLNNANAGTLENSGAFISFSGMETLAGGAGEDTLRGRNQANNWHITGNDEGTLAQRLDTPSDTVTFSAMENLSGGNLDDYFIFS